MTVTYLDPVIFNGTCHAPESVLLCLNMLGLTRDQSLFWKFGLAFGSVVFSRGL